MPLSYSQLAVYKRCPKQYEYLYVKKLSKGISDRESFGTSVHSALKRWGELEMRRTEDGGQRTDSQPQLFAEEPSTLPKIELTQETLIDLWHQCFIVEGYATRVEADMARLRGVELLRYFYDWWGKEEHHVVAVETGFKVTVEGVECTGRFDRVEQLSGGVRIIDFKTGHPVTQEQADSDLQLSLYAIAAAEQLKQPCVELVLLFLSEEGVLPVSTMRNSAQLNDAGKLIVALKDRLASGDYQPTPSVKICGNCPFRGVCPAAAIR